MKTYIGIKIVRAEPQVKDGKEGYKVVYPPDSYTSWCPKDVFEEANREVTGEGVPFSKALEALKKGKKIARAGWNGKGMYLFLQPGSVINGKTDGRNSVLKEMGFDVIINPHIDMKAADGTIVIGWLASQTDMLFDDWLILE